MDIRANITLLSQGSQTENFQVSVSFASAVSNFNLLNVSVSGDAGYVSSLSPIPNDATESINWIMNVTVIENTDGEITISLTGNVSQGDTDVTIDSDPISIYIDTLQVALAVSAQGLTVTQGADGNLTMQLPNFSQNVIGLTTSDFSISSTDNVLLEGLKYYVLGEGRTYKVLFVPPENSSGTFTVTANGNVTSLASLVETAFTFQGTTITYSNIIPYIANSDIPSIITPNTIFDVYVDFNINVTGLSRDDFLMEGINLSVPTIYRATSSTITARPTKASVPDTIPSDQATLANTVGSWTKSTVSGNTTAARYFLLRFIIPTTVADGVFNLTLRENAVTMVSG